MGDTSYHKKKASRKRRERKQQQKLSEDEVGPARAVPSAGRSQAERTDRQIVCPGASYKDLRIDGHAKVHAGDTYSVTNVHGSCAELHIHQVMGEEQIEKVESVLSALILLTIVFLMTGVQFCTALQRKMLKWSLSQRVSHQLAYLEDALGHIHMVEIGIWNWTSLHCQVMIAFEGKPGHQRITHEKYRLFDKSESGKLIDPRHPPKFSAFFKPGRHIRMSIHFESTEVRQDRCPKCELIQRCNVDSETICKRCEFSYRGNVDEDERITELDDDDDDVETEGPQWHRLHGARGIGSKDTYQSDPAKNTDKPGLFQRISISRSPLGESTHATFQAVQPGEDFQTDDQLAAILQAAEAHSGQHALRVLYEAAVRGRASIPTITQRPSLNGPSPVATSFPAMMSPADPWPANTSCARVSSFSGDMKRKAKVE